MAEVKIRPARVGDIPQLLDLLDLSTYGFLPHIFAMLSLPGADIATIIEMRLKDPTSQLSFKKARIATLNGKTAGFIMCENLPDPVTLLSDDTPDLLRPLFELETMAPGTTLINFVAAMPDMRGMGAGSALIKDAANTSGPNGLSLTIHDQNTGAKRLYGRLGFTEIARRPIVKKGWDNPAKDWILMVRP